MLDSYRHDCRLNFFDIEIDASEFSFEKKNDDENDDERMNENENAFEFSETVVVF